MGTRAGIIALATDGRWGRVYCGHDGYPSGAGAELDKHYNDQAKIDALIALGDSSGIGPELTDVDAYRKRGETDIEPRYYDSLEAALDEDEMGEEYVYVWTGKRWLGGRPGADQADLLPVEEMGGD